MAPPSPPSTHSRILEISLISAEDLASVSKNMKTYAIAWVQPDDKLATPVDQTGGTHPTWNDKLMFKVDDKFLNSEDAAIVVEIYAATWVKDALVGYVNVLIGDIFHLRSIADANINNSTKRTVALQVRRPSGRPQGILNMEIALLDGTKLEDPKPRRTTGKNREDDESTNEPENHNYSNTDAKISRSQSRQTDEITMEDDMEKTPEMGSIVNGGSVIGPEGHGSMVDGYSLCSSDVGPSASIVFAAISKGLYKPPVQNQGQTTETRKIREWTRQESGESLDMKLERWRSEVPNEATPTSYGEAKPSKLRKPRRNKGFSCFGNAFGCEISITCGGSKKRLGNGGNKICNLSSVDGNYSSIL